MRALVVVESMFGNTRDIAKALSRGAFPSMDVDLRDVAQAPTHLEADVCLLVIGAPTHAFGMSRPSTRADARSQGAEHGPSPDVGVREWLRLLEGPGRRTVAATFDTRVARPRLPGSAGRGVKRQLRELGFTVVDSPKSFWVEGTAGPLVAGETERARAWGAELSRLVLARRRHGGAIRT